MAARPHVTEVHDLHIWEITSGMPAPSAHVLVAPGEDCHAVRADLVAYLSREYGITHATLQVDHAGLPAAPGVIVVSEQHCDDVHDAHGPAYRPARPVSGLQHPPMADIGRSGCRNAGR